MNIYNLGLIPEKSIWHDLEVYSQDIKQNYGTEFLIGNNSIPHITVLQVEWDGTAKELWEKVMTLSGDIPLTLAGLCFLPGGDGKTWIEIPILKNRQLDLLQRQMLDYIVVPRNQIKNGILENYRPHISLGLSQTEHFKYLLDLKFPLLRSTDVNCSLCLGVSGENFQFKEILFGTPN